MKRSKIMTLTTRQVHEKLMTLRDKWMKAVADDASREVIREKRVAWHSYRDAIDPKLGACLDAAMTWIRKHHPVVYGDSSWTNCTEICEVLHEYHGIGRWISKDDTSLDDEFVLASDEVTPQSMILRAYAYADAEHDREIDIVAAGGLDVSGIEARLCDIGVMLDDVRRFDQQLQQLQVVGV